MESSPKSSATVPRHVAIIMDGNGRWAECRKLPRFAGHRAGVDRVKGVVQECGKCGVEVLTLFAFSSENWRRPPKEVGLLLELFMNTLRRQVRELHRNNVRLRVIGDRTAFPARLQEQIDIAETLTRDNSGLDLVVAANYGGRWDIVQAARELGARIAEGTLEPAQITAELFREYLALADLPEPDLFIRTGGEQRVSNFLLWQLAYTELYFTDVLWPDFDADAFAQALHSFAQRQRRFGRTGKQVAQDREL